MLNIYQKYFFILLTIFTFTLTASLSQAQGKHDRLLDQGPAPMDDGGLQKKDSEPSLGEKWAADKGLIKTDKNGKPLSTDDKPAYFGPIKKQPTPGGVQQNAPSSTAVSKGADTPTTTPKTARTETETFTNIDGAPDGKIVSHYDDNGNLIKTESFTEEGWMYKKVTSPTKDEEFEKHELFNQDGTVRATDYRDENGEIDHYEYTNLEGGVTKVSNNKKDKEGKKIIGKKEIYDAEGNLIIEEKYENGRVYEKEYYDKDGNKTKIAYYDTDYTCLKIEHLDKDGRVSHTEEWDGSRPLSPGNSPLENELLKGGFIKGLKPKPKPEKPKTDSSIQSSAQPKPQVGYTYGQQTYVYHAEDSSKGVKRSYMLPALPHGQMPEPVLSAHNQQYQTVMKMIAPPVVETTPTPTTTTGAQPTPPATPKTTPEKPKEETPPPQPVVQKQPPTKETPPQEKKPCPQKKEPDAVTKASPKP